MNRARVIFGLSGPHLTSDERAFFRAARPFGFILFGRNIQSADQVRRMTASLRDIAGDDALPILVDEEGGRVQRLRPLLGVPRPAAGRYGALFAQEPQAGLRAARLGARLIAQDLRSLGVTVNTAPCLDLSFPGACSVIGDRSFGYEATAVAALGRAFADGLIEGGIVPAIKHLPGHGRAMVDSHLALPRVAAPLADLETSDFAPFRALAHLPAALTAHIVFEAIDSVRPATLSDKVIRSVIRGAIGFDGLLMSDDLGMDALSGHLGSRTDSALNAGCDIVLHCSGNLAEMELVARAANRLEGDSLRRANRLTSQIAAAHAPMQDVSEAEFQELMAIV